MNSFFKTTTISTPLVTSLGSTDFTLNDDGSIDKKHASTTIGSYAAVFLTNNFEKARHDAVIKKYSSTFITENYIESLSDEELETALQKLGLLEKELAAKTISKRV